MNAGAIEILLVEDNPGDARLTLEAFKEGKVINHLTVMADGADALAYLRRQGQFSNSTPPDLIQPLRKTSGRHTAVMRTAISPSR